MIWVNFLWQVLVPDLVLLLTSVRTSILFCIFDVSDPMSYSSLFYLSSSRHLLIFMHFNLIEVCGFLKLSVCLNGITILLPPIEYVLKLFYGIRIFWWWSHIWLTLWYSKVVLFLCKPEIGYELGFVTNQYDNFGENNKRWKNLFYGVHMDNQIWRWAFTDVESLPKRYIRRMTLSCIVWPCIVNRKNSRI